MPVTPEYNRSVSSALKNMPSGRVLFQTSFNTNTHQHWPTNACHVRCLFIAYKHECYVIYYHKTIIRYSNK